MKQIEQLIKKLPKVELHVHIEGTLKPAHVLALAKRNRVDDFKYKSVEELNAETKHYKNLGEFVQVLDESMRVLQTEQDFYEMTFFYLREAKAQNIVHAEFFFAPQIHLQRGIGLLTFMNGIIRAMDDADRILNMSSSILLAFIRNLPEADAIATLAKFSAWANYIVGIGLVANEQKNPPHRFQKLYQLARSLGLRATVHAGEEGPPAYI
ncbi:unnamed protein product [Didymodactylos carnosus]|uniref:Adenosine deaminase domain-containing protein n=1 Tax=Didymodactylos carnosus TaxID=1234261 RepID=A0A8S2CM34_9BILA|nr:unnamed protein product [Didymodactylos carnosus]CAF3523868.1 unnamed protein product [Didymodactylos carnosus]